jgi:hypothetical protein
VTQAFALLGSVGPVATARPSAYSRMMDDVVTHFFDTPAYHLLAIERDTAAVIRMDRAAYHRSIFLDRRIAALEQRPRAAPLDRLIEVSSRAAEQPACWIFHIAHCGSTLLARLVDIPTGSLVLREPPPLRQLGLAKAGNVMPHDWGARLHLARAAAARRFDARMPTVVKANVPVNFMLDALPKERAILLHFPLGPYLLAVLRTPDHRNWVERLTAQVVPALAAATGLSASASLAERAAALWLFQMLAFDRHLRANPDSRSLEAGVFFGDPLGAAEAVAAHFRLSDFAIREDAASIVSTYSKNPEHAFDESVRRARERADAERLAPEVAEARRWIDGSRAAAALPGALPRPLRGSAVMLLA